MLEFGLNRPNLTIKSLDLDFSWSNLTNKTIRGVEEEINIAVTPSHHRLENIATGRKVRKEKGRRGGV